MAKKVEVIDNFLYITDTVTGVIEFEKASGRSEFRKKDSIYYELFHNDILEETYRLTDLVDSNLLPFSDFKAWKNENTGGFKTASGGSGAIVVTANRTLISNATGNVTASLVTNVELSAIDGDTLSSDSTIDDTDRIVLNDGGVMGQNSFTKVWEWIINKVNGGASTILTTNLTANRALISNATGKVGTSTLTATQLQGITTLGTVIESVILTTLPTSVGTNLTSITLTPGKWLITGGVSLNQTDPEKVSDYIALAISSTATAWAQVTIVQNRGVMARMVSGEDAGICCIPISVTVATNTIYYLKAFSDFTTETNSLQAILTATKVGI